MKKILCAALAAILCTSFSGSKVMANEEIPKDVLTAVENRCYIASGSGTIDDPYILDESYNPIKEYLDQQYYMNTDSTSLLRSGKYNIALRGTKHYVGDGEARWYYTNGGDTSGRYNTTIYKNVDYIGFTSTAIASTKLTNPSTVDRITEIIKEGGSSATVAAALSKVIGGAAASAILRLMGYGLIAHATYSTMAGIISDASIKIYNEAINKKLGTISVTFDYSINGTWYQNTAIDVWDTYPYAQEPLSAFGNGVFRNGSRI